MSTEEHRAACIELHVSLKDYGAAMDRGNEALRRLGRALAPLGKQIVRPSTPMLRAVSFFWSGLAGVMLEWAERICVVAEAVEGSDVTAKLAGALDGAGVPPIEETLAILSELDAPAPEASP